MNLPTKKAVDHYIDDNNENCPFCTDGATESICETVQEHAYLWQDMQCATCGKIWRNEYRLSHISVSTMDENNQPGRWYSDEAAYVRDMYIHEYQDVIDEHNKKK
jgi:hypothetical protein